MSRPNLHKMQTPSRPFAHQPHPNSRFPVRRHPRKQRHPTSNNAHPSRAATPYSQSFVVPTKHRRPSVHRQPTQAPPQLPHPSPPPRSPHYERTPHRPDPRHRDDHEVATRINVQELNLELGHVTTRACTEAARRPGWAPHGRRQRHAQRRLRLGARPESRNHPVHHNAPDLGLDGDVPPGIPRIRESDSATPHPPRRKPPHRRSTLEQHHSFDRPPTRHRLSAHTPH